jgi:uncharacterized protein (DUF58 family)
MATVIRDDDNVSTGMGATLGVILAILLVLALLVGGWFLFFRQPADTGSDTNIEINQPSNGETTTGP